MEFNAKLGFKIFKQHTDTVNGYLNASFDFYNLSPTYFEQYYFSNNYLWSNNFERTQTMRVGGEFGIPRLHFKVSAASHIIRQYIYFNSEAVPAQLDTVLNVQTLSVSKDFFLWRFGFANQFTWQKTNRNEILNLPQFSLYHSTYIEFYLVPKVLLTQIGGEMRITSAYESYGYSPATSVFYPSGRYNVGKYPVFNAFCNIKIRGVLMFFKWEHLNDGVYQDFYAPADCYPITDLHFMFGILWRFGD